MAKSSSSKVYLVRRLNHEIDCYPFDHSEGFTGTPIRAFTSKKAAQTYCEEVEQRTRLQFTPFDFVHDDIIDTEIEPIERLIEQIRAIGLIPPEKTKGRWGTYFHWNQWWDEVGWQSTPEQRLALWELFPDLKLYEVVETTWGEE